MDDILEMGYQRKTHVNGVNSEAKFENKTLWNYSEAIKVDNQRQQQNFDELEENKEMSMEERIQMKLAEYGIDIPTAQVTNPEDEKAQREKEKAQLLAAPKINAKHHYDKEDLISFHQIFISKPLVKAC